MWVYMCVHCRPPSRIRKSRDSRLENKNKDQRKTSFDQKLVVTIDNNTTPIVVLTFGSSTRSPFLPLVPIRNRKIPSSLSLV